MFFALRFTAFEQQFSVQFNNTFKHKFDRFNKTCKHRFDRVHDDYAVQSHILPTGNMLPSNNPVSLVRLQNVRGYHYKLLLMLINPRLFIRQTKEDLVVYDIFLWARQRFDRRHSRMSRRASILWAQVTQQCSANLACIIRELHSTMFSHSHERTIWSLF